MALSESGLALEFVDNYCADLRYVREWDKWLVWNGGAGGQERAGRRPCSGLQGMAFGLKYRPEARELTVASKKPARAQAIPGGSPGPGAVRPPRHRLAGPSSTRTRSCSARPAGPWT